MPITYDIDVARRLALFRVSGEVSMQDIRQAISGAVLDARFEVGFDILSDHTAVERAINTQQVRQMTAHLRTLAERLTQSRLAIVANRPASYGMMRMFAVHAEQVPLETRVFNSREEALSWLGRGCVQSLGRDSADEAY